MDGPLARSILAGIIALAAALLGRPAAAGEDGASILAAIGVDRGICVLLEDRECRAGVDLARRSDLTFWVQLAADADVDAARKAADAAGLLGGRIQVAKGGPARIALAADIADAVVALDGAAVPDAEALRALRPDGVALIGGRAVRKPWPAGVDDWSHHYHGPDNNPQSLDKVARAPFLTAFVAEPRYAPAPQAAVASGGRLFMAFGHIAWHEREEAAMNTLMAVSGWNGTLLWKRPLPAGIMVDRSTLIATPRELFLGGVRSCRVLDAATGREEREITVPAGMSDGSYWKWMALQDGVLFALVGKDEPLDEEARWRKTSHGWPWDGISKGYNKEVYDWGFAPAIFAIDAASGKVLWHRSEERPIDARSTCLRKGRLYIGRFGDYLAALDARTGSEIWRRTAAKDPAVFQAIGPYRPGHGYVEGWKTTVYLKATDTALYFVGPQVNWLTALSADDGRFLWKYPGKDLHIVIRDDGVYTIGPQHSTGHTHRLDATTGAVLATYPVSRRACTRSTGSADGIFFRAEEGSCRLDLAAGRPQWISPMRPSCQVGVVIAGGRLYWVPWACDCDLQLFGAISLAPAGDFRFGQEAREADRLEMAAGGPAGAGLEVAAGDWPQYRGDAARAARTGAAVAGKRSLAWTFSPKSAFEATAPIAAGGLVFSGGSDGSVRALDAATGEPRWTAWTAGAVRYPPAIAVGRAVAGSSDGWVYAFDAATGRPAWRFRAAPEERMIPLYGKLISTWPAASAPLAADGVVYVAAGLTPHDGTHVYALDAATGRIRWQENGSGHLDAFSMRGISAQGDTLLHDGKLYLAGGNATSPGVYDAATGKCLSGAPASPGSQAPRGRELRLAAAGSIQVSGQPMWSTVPTDQVFDGSTRWERTVVIGKDAKLFLDERRDGGVRSWTLSARRPGDEAGELWSQPLPAEPVRWGLAVDREGRLIVALRDGRVLCYR